MVGFRKSIKTRYTNRFPFEENGAQLGAVFNLHLVISSSA